MVKEVKLFLHIPYGQENVVQVKEIIKKLGEWCKENKFARLVTLSLTIVIHFHIRNGAKQIHINDETQNFEYKLSKSKKYGVIYVSIYFKSRSKKGEGR